MLSINLQNVEKLVFYDPKLQTKLPDLSLYFEKWRALFLHGIPAQSVFVDFLNALNSNHIKALEEHFGTEIKVDNIDCNLVKCLIFPLSEAECALCGLKGYRNFTVHRDDNYLYICFWR